MIVEIMQLWQLFADVLNVSSNIARAADAIATEFIAAEWRILRVRQATISIFIEHPVSFHCC